MSKVRLIRTHSAGTPDVYRQYSEMEKAQFRERFETVCRNLGEMDKYLGMILAGTNDTQFVTGVVNTVRFSLGKA